MLRHQPVAAARYLANGGPLQIPFRAPFHQETGVVWFSSRRPVQSHRFFPGQRGETDQFDG